MEAARFGDDQSVILLRRGPDAEKIMRCRALDTQKLADQAAATIERYEPVNVFIYGVGGRGGVVDRLRHAGP